MFNSGKNTLVPEKSLLAALHWIRASFRATGFRGSAHSYMPLIGWKPAYPETSGYLVETLVETSRLPGQADLAELARTCLNWLCDIQLPSGAFTAHTVEYRTPSVFNTSQVLLGFAKGLQEPGLGNAEEKLRWTTAGTRALHWLIENHVPGKGWPAGAYVPDNADPSYYTRVLWGMARMAQVLETDSADALIRSALLRYAGRITPAGGLRNWGFWPDKPAHTHTIAYALDGLWRTAVLLQEKDIEEQAVAMTRTLLEVRRRHDRTAGAYAEDWTPRLNYFCVTGNAQLSLLVAEMGQSIRSQDWHVLALEVFGEVAHAQCLLRGSPVYGGIPGSIPFSGPYLRFRYPNWAAKFWIDAIWVLYPAHFALTPVSSSSREPS